MLFDFWGQFRGPERKKAPLSGEELGPRAAGERMSAGGPGERPEEEQGQEQIIMPPQPLEWWVERLEDMTGSRVGETFPPDVWKGEVSREEAMRLLKNARTLYPAGMTVKEYLDGFRQAFEPPTIEGSVTFRELEKAFKYYELLRSDSGKFYETQELKARLDRARKMVAQGLEKKEEIAGLVNEAVGGMPRISGLREKVEELLQREIIETNAHTYDEVKGWIVGVGGLGEHSPEELIAALDTVRRNVLEKMEKGEPFEKANEDEIVILPEVTWFRRIVRRLLLDFLRQRVRVQPLRKESAPIRRKPPGP